MEELNYLKLACSDSEGYRTESLRSITNKASHAFHVAEDYRNVEELKNESVIEQDDG